jgi:ATP-dependent DNA ligase
MAKRADSRYLSGARSNDWLKVKAGKRQYWRG